MEEISFRGLAIVAAVGFFVPLLVGFVRLRVPSVVLEITAGAILGPSVLGWVHVDPPIHIFSRLGLASLLFLVGLETELDRLRGAPLRLAASGYLLSFLIALGFCSVLETLGMLETPLFVAILLTSSAIGIVIPLLKDAGELATPFGQLLIVGMSLADFGVILILAILFSAQGGSPAQTVLSVAILGLLCVLAGVAVTGLGRWKRLSEILRRLQDTSAMIRVRGAAFFLITFVVVVEQLGLELMLGAFAAGVLLGYLDRDAASTHPEFHSRLQAVGFGIFIPVFFVSSGIQLDLRLLGSGGTFWAAVPLFLIALLAARGIPALVYRRVVGPRRAVVAGLLQATSLPLLVVGARIGVELDKISEATSAALVSAGMLSVLIFPAVAQTLLENREN